MVFRLVKRIAGIMVGASVAAVGLEAFLLPNKLLDGGVVGISIIFAELFSKPFGLFLIIINLPFIYLGYKKLGRLFAISSLFGIVTLSILTYSMHSIGAFTHDPILAAIFGGAIVGAGVGLVIRYGGTLDGSEIIAILIDKKTPFTVGEAVLFMNLFIIGSAGLIFGWDKAMYSLVAYFVAYKVIDITVVGFNESKSVWIVSEEHERIGKIIYEALGRKVTYVKGHGSKQKGLVLSVITRFEEQHLKELVRHCDPNAFLVINNVHEVMGRKFKNKPAKPILTSNDTV